MGAFLTTFVFYLVMGVVSGAYFGDGVSAFIFHLFMFIR